MDIRELGLRGREKAEGEQWIGRCEEGEENERVRRRYGDGEEVRR